MSDYEPKIEFQFDMEELAANGPNWKEGDYLVVEHLTMADLQQMGEIPTSDGVVRMSLADDETGANPRKLVECAITFEDHDLIKKALLTLSDWAHGFILASNLRNEGVGMLVRTPKMPIDLED